MQYGGLLFEKGQAEVAQREFSEVIRINPLNLNAFYNRASANEQMGEHAAALADLEKWLELGGADGVEGRRSEVEAHIRRIKKSM